MPGSFLDIFFNCEKSLQRFVNIREHSRKQTLMNFRKDPKFKKTIAEYLRDFFEKILAKVSTFQVVTH